MAPQPTNIESQGDPSAHTLPGGSLAERDTGPWSSVDERAPERDLIAAVVYYNSARQLFGAAAAQPTLGKYPLERVLGSGANGSVLLGRNPDTGGEVAIKILRPEVHSDPEREAMRLRREAHALAKLAHPNVVPIYDAGVADGALYIVMRRVGGATLRDAQAGRSWRQIVDLYLDVARGLAAVHAAGLVHRDVKPDNVLLSDDGHVMLADFGLVCVAAAEGGHRSDASPRDLRADRPLSAKLSHAGEIHGTPAYMSPEALAGGPPAPAADLFALAAALYEALCGCLPYPGDTAFAVYAAASAGRLAPPPSDAGLPTWLYEQLKIALDPDPARRPATTEALLAALDYRPREGRRRRRLFGLGAAAATLAGLAIGALAMRTPDPCERRDPLISAALHAQIGAEDPRLAALLREYSGAWESAERQICRATFHDAAQAPQLFEVRVACLDHRARELRALLDRRSQSVSKDSIERTQVEAVAHPQDLLAALAALEAPSECAHAALTPTPNAAQRLALAPLQGALARARAAELASDYEDADRQSEAALDLARALAFPPALSDALLTRARARWLLHDAPGAAEHLLALRDLAEANALDLAGFDAAALLTKIAALELHDPVRGHEWARQAEAKLARIGADDRRRAQLLSDRGLLAAHLDRDLTLAERLHRQALEIRGRLPGEARLLRVDSHTNLGNVLAARGDLGAALAHYDRSQALIHEVFGADHQRQADELYNRADALRQAGELGRALALAERALGLYQRQPAPSPSDLADAHVLIATILEYRGDLGRGRAHARLAVAHLTRAPESSTPRRHAQALERLGSFERELGDRALAMSAYERALTSLEGHPGDDLRVAIHLNRALTLAELHRPAEAQSACERAARLLDADPSLAPFAPHLGRTRGRVHHLAGELHLAIPAYEAALVGLDDRGLDAELRYWLAEAMIAAGRPPGPALDHARAALEFYQGRGDDPELAAELARFIDTHT